MFKELFTEAQATMLAKIIAYDRSSSFNGTWRVMKQKEVDGELVDDEIMIVIDPKKDGGYYFDEGAIVRLKPVKGGWGNVFNGYTEVKMTKARGY